MKLERLDLQGITNISDDGLRGLIEYNRGLRKIDLQNCSVSTLE